MEEYKFLLTTYIFVCELQSCRESNLRLLKLKDVEAGLRTPALNRQVVTTPTRLRLRHAGDARDKGQGIRAVLYSNDCTKPD